jgi:hypothetical protein
MEDGDKILKVGTESICNQIIIILPNQHGIHAEFLIQVGIITDFTLVFKEAIDKTNKNFLR